MKRFTILIFLLSISLSGLAQADYYYPSKNKFNPEITSPWEFLGYDIGDHHTRYDLMVEYLKVIAGESDRAVFEVFGYTEEKRPQVILTVSSPENMNNLENIRNKHLQLSYGSKEKIPGQDNIPLIIQLGFNVHGNEATAGEASLLAAYYLLASEENEIERLLSEAVVFIEPVLNPDGRSRFASWANMNRGNPPIADPNDREHNEAWPGGRTNHYWFDLNRDWLPLSQVESRNRIERYHKWLPNIITDHHEMGTNSTFFFEPTKKGSENPIISSENYVDLNMLFAKEYAKSLNMINHYYDAGRSFDNSYPGYGSTYGDVHGGLAILFEQASSRGLVQKTDLGYNLTYRLGVRNQLFGALTTVRTAVSNKEMINDYMRRFYYDALEEAEKDPVKAYLFGDENDINRTISFINLLRMHNIDVYRNEDDIRRNGMHFKPGVSWFVPTSQKQYKMVRTMFEANHSFPDSIFYDATAWALIYSYGLPFTEMDRVPEGNMIEDLPTPEYIRPEYSDYGYVFNWSDYNAASTLYYLQDKGIMARAAWDEFVITESQEERSFSRGSVFIPVQYQDMDAQRLYEIICEAAGKSRISIFPVSGSLTSEGPWLGNGSFRALKKPKVLLLTGDGISSTSAGALWHFFESKINLPVVKISIDDIYRINLADYTSLILPSMYSALDEEAATAINSWVRNGGNLIALGYAARLLSNADIAELEYDSKIPEASSARIDYEIRRQERGKHSIGGIFCETDLDTSHPLGFGYNNRKLTVYRNHTLFVKPDEGLTNNVAIYTDNPLISGFATPENIEKMKGSVSLMSLSKGRGNIIVFVDDPVFRGCWYGTNKLLMNALFFGPEI